MTITSSSSAPLFVVVGSTGTQGRSVVDAIAADAKEYRVRAITRDTSKPAAQELKSLGAEVVAGDISDAASIEKAFQGADVVYGMTVSDYWSPNGEERVSDCISTVNWALCEQVGRVYVSKCKLTYNARALVALIYV
jgi:putative NADH-flavin reductase